MTGVEVKPMVVIYVLLLVAALVCFLIAALKPELVKLNLIALGLFFATLVPFIQMCKRL